MPRSPICRFTSLLALIVATPALAQEIEAVPSDAASDITAPEAGPGVDDSDAAYGDMDDAEGAYDAEEGQIVVIAGRYFGGVDAPQQPVLSLDQEDVASYGAGSLAELITALGPTVSSARGRGGGHPIVLVNGQRISGFRELRNYPPESVNRVEVLPEEVAQRYGFSPDQRVVNFILKGNFSSREIELDYGQPARGGYHTVNGGLTYLRIDGPNRLNLAAELQDSTRMLESDRGVIQRDAPDVAGDPDPARARTLISGSSSMGLNGTWTHGLSKGGSLAINASAQHDDSMSLRGLDSVMLQDPGGDRALRTFDGANPLRSKRRNETYAIGATLNRGIGDWQLTATLDASHSRNRTLTDRRRDTSLWEDMALGGLLPIDGALPALVGPRVQDRALTRNSGLEALATLSGRLLQMPAGAVSATVSSGYKWDRIVSSDTRNPGSDARLNRGDASLGVNLAVPLTSRRENVLSAVGDITLNLSGGMNHYSDFGTLHDWSAGLTWQVVPSLSLQASYIWREAVPSLANLGSPQIIQPNEPIFDFVTGQSVLASVISGGNPFLKAETQRDLKFSASWQLPFLPNARLNAEYIRNRSDDVTASFPLLTPAIEQAFPDRVIRDADGRLVTLDRRPITFAQQNWKRLRYGLDISGQLGKAQAEPPRQSEGRGDSAGGGRRGQGSMMPGGGHGNRGRWGLSAYHTVEFANRVLIAPGGPVLDLLRGDALSGGGTARHKAEVSLRMFKNGIGGRISSTYRSPTTVKGSGQPGSTDLRFGGLATVSLHMFIDLGVPGRVQKEPDLFKNARLTLKVNNLFNSRQNVRDELGNTPLSYQKYLIDPVGRFVSLNLRKVF